MRFVLFGALVSGFLYQPALAAKSGADDDKVICKRNNSDADTGSNMRRSRKTCLKKSEWRELAQATNRAVRKIEDRGNAIPPAALGTSPQ